MVVFKFWVSFGVINEEFVSTTVFIINERLQIIVFLVIAILIDIISMMIWRIEYSSKEL